VAPFAPIVLSGTADAATLAVGPGAGGTEAAKKKFVGVQAESLEARRYEIDFVRNMALRELGIAIVRRLRIRRASIVPKMQRRIC
jgi:hypothetical protein